MRAIPIATASALLAAALASQPADAATRSYPTQSNPADACQLSIPTTDTKVRPKATGFRNEGSTNAFIICSFSDIEWNSLTRALVWFVTLDELPHDITCTGVIGIAQNEGPNLLYSSKTVTAAPYSYGAPRSIQWIPVDFGGTYPFFTQTYTFSFTCLLPPQVAIVWMEAEKTLEIGQ